MKHLLFTLMVIILPFAVVSCNDTSSKKVKKQTDLKQIIQSNNAYSSIKWITLEGTRNKNEKVTS